MAPAAVFHSVIAWTAVERGFEMHERCGGVGRRGYGQREKTEMKREGLPVIGSLASSAPVFSSGT